MIVCEICKREFKGNISLGLHLKGTHKITTEFYYLNYLNNVKLSCLFCGKETKFKNTIRGYNKFCSPECSNKSEESKELAKNTRIEKYGNVNYNNREKYKETCLSLHGVENLFQLDFIKEKSKQTCLKKYGVDAYRKTNEFRERTKKTCIKKYGFDNPIKNKEVKQKAMRTMKERYGVEHASQSKKILNKYLKKKKEKFIKTKLNFILDHYNLTLLEPLKITKEFHMVKCKTCNSIFSTVVDYLFRHYGLCKVCYPRSKSLQESEVCEFVKSLNVNVIENSRQIIQPKELDIYIPDRKIAIEYNGSYWHSEENGKDRNYHMNKYLKCKEKEIRLIQIFEDEWINKKEIVKNKLLYFVKPEVLTQIYTAFCFKKEIDEKIKNDFLDKYHVDGSEDVSNLFFGIFYENNLVGVSSILKSDLNYQIIRFCNHPDYFIHNFIQEIILFIKLNYNWKTIQFLFDLRWPVENYKDTLINYQKPMRYLVKQNNKIFNIWGCGKENLILENDNENF